MVQQRVTFEWVIEENQSGGRQGEEITGVEQGFGLSAGERILANRLIRGLSMVLVVICAAAGAALTPAERERKEAEQGIEFVLRQENQAWHVRDRSMFEGLIDPNVTPEWREQWRDYWRAAANRKPEYHAKLVDVRDADGLMQATVVTDQPAIEWWQTSSYREARFYRRDGQSWLRTVPPSEYWGERRSLETEHLRFVFYEADDAAVQAAADRLEQAYVGMYQVLGLDVPPPHAKLTIRVLPQPFRRWSSSPSELPVTSPILSRVPEGQSDADFLAHDIMGWFTYRALRDATPGMASRYLYRWPILVWGLRGWIRDDLLDQPSPWHAEAIEVLRNHRESHLPFGLSDVTELRGEGRPTREQVIMRYLAAESLIRFVVETHGRERLPELLTALVRHGSVAEMIPMLYGHSAEKFVADWNIYLLEYYEVEAY